MNRYNTEARRVTPATEAQRNTYPIAPAQLLGEADQPLNTSQSVSVIDSVFTPQPLTKDAYSPVQRAVGLVVRLLLLAVVYAILAYGIVSQAALAEPWLYILFAIPMLLTVAYMSQQTDKYTPAGVELERIAAAERTEFTKGERQERILAAHLANQQELRRLSLAATIRMLEKGDSHEKQ